MRNTRLTAHIAKALLALCISCKSHALGMGDAKVYSYLNEPLVAELELTAAEGLDPGKIIARLASVQDFMRAGIARPKFLTGISFEMVVYQDCGYLHLQTSEPITTPTLELLVELTWPDGSLIKNYKMLIDPPPANLAAKKRSKTMQQLARSEQQSFKRLGAVVTTNESLFNKTLTDHKVRNAVKKIASRNPIELIPEVVPDITTEDIDQLVALNHTPKPPVAEKNAKLAAPAEQKHVVIEPKNQVDNTKPEPKVDSKTTTPKAIAIAEPPEISTVINTEAALPASDSPTQATEREATDTTHTTLRIGLLVAGVILIMIGGLSLRKLLRQLRRQRRSKIIYNPNSLRDKAKPIKTPNEPAIKINFATPQTSETKLGDPDLELADSLFNTHLNLSEQRIANYHITAKDPAPKPEPPTLTPTEQPHVQQNPTPTPQPVSAATPTALRSSSDFSQVIAVATEEPKFFTSDDPAIEIKLSLAKQYLAVGDLASARAILLEVKAAIDESQHLEIDLLLSRIS